MRSQGQFTWIAGLLALAFLAGSVLAQEAEEERPRRQREGRAERKPRSREKGRRTRMGSPTPNVQNESYGPHAAQVFDLWLAKSEQPTPLLVFIHGGGFRGGSKNNLSRELLGLCLAEGISFATIEYRLTGIGHYPMQHHDCARAIQHIRHHAAKWNIDPKRIAATGGSAGAGLSQWLGFHDDLADPDSDDPIARESTRITCALPTNAQCTYDPREIKKIVPGNAYDNPALKFLFGVPSNFNWDGPIAPEVEARIQDCGPLSLLTKDDCPVYIVNNAGACKDGNIHHGNFGKRLEQEMTKIGLECVRRMNTDYPVNGRSMHQEMIAFMKKHFGISAAAPKTSAGPAPEGVQAPGQDAP